MLSNKWMFNLCLGLMLCILPSSSQARHESKDGLHTKRLVLDLYRALHSPLEKERTRAADVLKSMKKSTLFFSPLLLPPLKNDDWNVRWAVAKVLYQIGHNAYPATKPLIKLLADPYEDVRSQAQKTLIRIGKKHKVIAGDLLKVFKGKHQVQQKNAIVVLKKLGKLDNKSIQLLSKELSSLTDSVRKTCLLMILKNYQSTKYLEPAIRVALKEKKWSLRQKALLLLPHMTHNKKSLALLALKAADDSSKHVRTTAVWALGGLGISTPKITSTLIRKTEDSYNKVRRNAAWSLGKLRVMDKKVVSILLEMLKHSDWRQRLRAVQALGRIGKPANKITTALLKMNNQGYWKLRKEVISALWRVGKPKDKILKHFAKAMKDTAERVRRATSWAIGELGENSPEVQRALLHALAKDKSSTVRKNSAWALGKLRKADPEVYEGLIKATKHWSKQVRSRAYSSIGRLRQPKYHLLMLLLKGLKDKAANPRIGASWSIQMLGNTTRGLIPRLLPHLADKHDLVRGNIAIALSYLRRNTHTVLPALLKALAKTKRPSWILYGIGTLKRRSPKAIKALQEALEHKSVKARIFAAWALWKLKEPLSKILPHYYKLIKHKSKTIRRYVIWCVSFKVKERKQVIPFIKIGQKDPHWRVRSATADTIRYLKFPEKQFRALLKPLLEDRNTSVRRSAQKALKSLKKRLKKKKEAAPKPAKKDKPFKPSFYAKSPSKAEKGWLKQLKSKDKRLKVKAIQQISKLKNPSKKTISTLRKALQSSDTPFSTEAAWGLGRIGHLSNKVVPGLLDLLESLQAQQKVQALRSIKQIYGTRGLVIRQRIKKAKKPSGQPSSRPSKQLSEDLQILGWFHRTMMFETPQILWALLDKNPWVKSYAAMTIKSQKKLAGQVFTHLLQRYKKAPAQGSLLLKIFKDMGPAYAYSIKRLLWGTESSDTLLKGTSEQAVQVLQEQIKKLFPLLKHALKAKDWKQRKAAVETLAAFGHLAKEHTPSLKLLLKDKHAKVRDSVAKALKKLKKAKP